MINYNTTCESYCMWQPVMIFFFMSKDVVRIILANIYMYEENWSSAKVLLSKVHSNGYYQLYAADEHDATMG